MSNVAIRVENLGKQYRIGGRQASYRTIREALIDAAKAPVRRVSRLWSNEAAQTSGAEQTIWALQDVSFEVKHGEAVGVIGANGAGKSTLLKLLSRITEPTHGIIDLYGRVGSLLEVGTGFHPELTGRENIYLNGAILGMNRDYISRKFDEIVDFAEVEKFIDTPVKHYSSGMYLRLAFAVAAHLEPEILLVDEVLAVGDAAFQKKCLNKMGDVASAGRTVLFVSHNMGAVSTLCQRTLWVNKGMLALDGPAAPTVSAYLNSGSSAAGRKMWAEGERPGNRAFRLVSTALKNSGGDIVSEVYISETITIEVEFDVIEPDTKLVLSLNLWDSNGSEVFSSLSNTEENSYHGKSLQPGRYCSRCKIYGNLLNEGRYYVTFIGVSGYWSDGFRTDYALAFDALEDGALKRDYPGKYGGVIRPKLIWGTEPVVKALNVKV